MAEKPGHILEIPDSLGRDVDKAKAGNLKNPLPVEAFMSDAALQQVAAQTQAAAQPVHAGQLRPISSAEAAHRRTFNGDTLPDFPQSRRVIPAPFQRPSINGGRHGKSWQYVPASQIAKDDIVPDVGLVTDVREETVYATVGEVLGVEPGQLIAPDTTLAAEEKVAVGIAVVVISKGGTVRAFRQGDQVRVFRKDA